MTVVCLTEDAPGLRYTVNVLHRRHGVALVVLEDSKRGLFWRDLRRFGIMETCYRAWLVARRLWPTGRLAGLNDRVFGADWRALDPSIRVLRTREINSPEVREALSRLRPDVVVCQGTTLVRPETITFVPTALNIHAGLSPYYRGSRCTEWAVATGDVGNIGVTVHALTRDVDGGAVLGQMRVDPRDDDTVASLNARIVVAGTAIVSGALDRLAAGRPLELRPQPPGEGWLFYRRQWSRHLDRHVRHLLRRGELRRMRARPSAAPRPLVAPWPDSAEAREAGMGQAAE